jgi:ribonuclease P protein component
MIKDRRYETHLSTQQDQTRPDPRLQKKNVHQTGQTNYQPQKSQGPQAAGVIKSDLLLPDPEGSRGAGGRSGPRLKQAVASRPSAFFQKKDRILKRSQFQQLSTVGYRIHSQCFIAVFQPGKIGFSRLGVTVTKKVGGAVTRNQIRRLVREFFRRNRETLRGHYDLNIIAKKEAAKLTTGETFAALERLFKNIASRHVR